MRSSGGRTITFWHPSGVLRAGIIALADIGGRWRVAGMPPPTSKDCLPPEEPHAHFIVTVSNAVEKGTDVLAVLPDHTEPNAQWQESTQAHYRAMDRKLTV